MTEYLAWFSSVALFFGVALHFHLRINAVARGLDREIRSTSRETRSDLARALEQLAPRGHGGEWMANPNVRLVHEAVPLPDPSPEPKQPPPPAPPATRAAEPVGPEPWMPAGMAEEVTRG